MTTAKILNVVAIIFFTVSIIIFEPLIIFLSIGFLAASMIYWRIIANRKSNNDVGINQK